MRAARALAPLLLATCVASGAEIREYSTRVDVDADGAGHASSTIVIAGDPSEMVVIPLSHAAWTSLRVTETTDGLRVDQPAEKAATLRVTLPPATSASSRLSITFDVPEVFAKPESPGAGAKLTMPRESRTLRYAFVNSQVTRIRDFRMQVALPEGTRFQAIREQLPKQTKSEAEPRVRLGGERGRQTALLRLANLGQGDDTSMVLEAVPNRRSLLWLVAGVVLSTLYLFRFRDLVFPNDGSTKTR